MKSHPINQLIRNCCDSMNIAKSTSEVLNHGVQRVAARWQLFAMLAVFNGLVSSILFGPAYRVMQSIMAALATSADEETATAAMDLLSSGFSTLLLGHLAVTALNAALLVPWARAVAREELIPLDGAVSVVFTRSLRAAWHLFLAGVITVVVFAFGGTILFSLASTLGFLAMVIVFAGGIGLAWVGFMINASANFAVTLEARDRPVSLAAAAQRLRPQAIPAATSLACFWVISMVAGMLVSGLIGENNESLYRLSLAVSGTFGFAASALHIAALGCLQPDS